jgi:hypothetical protein
MRASHTISAIARGSGDAAGAGADAVPDYELLELILFRAAPRRDTKPLAKALLARFGTFAEALNAPEELLREVCRASGKQPSPSSSWCGRRRSG